MGVFHTGFATLLAQHDESFVDVTHFDASKCSEDGFDKGDLIRRKGRGIALVVRTLVGGVYKPLVPQHIGKWLRIYSYSAMNPRKADQKQLKITVSEDVYSLLKRLAGVKETSMNRVVGEAIDLYLESDHARELIDRHHLED